MGNGMPRSSRVTVSQAKHNQTKILNAKSARYLIFCKILYHFNQLDSHTSQAPVFCLKLVLVTGHQDQCLEGPTCDKAHKREFSPKTSHLATFLASFAHVGTYYHLPNTFPSQIIHFGLASV